MTLEISLIYGLGISAFFFIAYHFVLQKKYDDQPRKEKNFVLLMQVNIFRFFGIVTMLGLLWMLYLLVVVNNIGNIYDQIVYYLFRFNMVFSVLFILPILEAVWGVAQSIINSVDDLTSNEEKD